MDELGADVGEIRLGSGILRPGESARGGKDSRVRVKRQQDSRLRVKSSHLLMPEN